MPDIKKKTRTIRQTTIIPAPPADVYAALMTARIHAKFTGSPARGSAKVGGKFSAWDGYISAKNLKLVKGRKIVQAWMTSEWPADYPPSTLELTLQSVPGGTKLTMVHSEVPASQANDYRQGWTDYYWKPLKAYFRGQA